MRILTITLLLVTLPGMVVAGGDPVKGKDKVILCIGCHGLDGNSSSSTFPHLAWLASAASTGIWMESVV